MNQIDAFALVVGVGGPDFEATVRDASSVAAVLKDMDGAGYPKENIQLLTNESATRKNIIKGLQYLITKSKENPDSTVMVYYSGHGIEVREDDGGNNYYLFPHGSDYANKADTMISGAEFSSFIDDINGKKVFVVLDCCYAASMHQYDSPLVTKTFEDKQLKGSSKKLLQMLNKGEGRVFVSSCDDNELSVIFRNARNSLFTEVFLEAIKGRASRNNALVHVLEVLTHVILEVPERLKDFDHNQRPIVNEVVDINPEFYVSKNIFYRDSALDTKSKGDRPVYGTFKEMSEILFNYQKQEVKGVISPQVDLKGNITIEGNTIGKATFISGDINSDTTTINF